jgi:hypothetical protein
VSKPVIGAETSVHTVNSMPRRTGALLTTLALVVSVLGRSPVAAESAPGPATFRVGFIGDTGYNAEGEANLLRVREAANSAGLAFVVHDGDIWMGQTRCDDDRLRQVKAVLNGFRTLVYTPGDNEWQDCPSPDGRLPAIRRVFFSQPTSLGTQPVPQYRQKDFPENARWERGGILFATLNVPGPYGGGPAAEANVAWLDGTFDRAAAIKAAAVMVIWQDDPVDGSSAALVARLKQRSLAFRRPVVLVHGDTHRFKLDNPWRDVRNLTRLETFPTFTPEWVKVIVNPTKPEVFSFARMRA